MPGFAREELKALLETQEGPCLSLYMPSHRSGAGTKQDPIRFKNLLRKGEDQLLAGGMRAREAEAFLQPAQRLLDDGFFWRHQSDGLALFRSPALFRHYRLPVGFPELAIVTHRFHLKPLLSLWTSDEHYYLLALSQNSIRLVEGTRLGAHELPVEGMPTSLKDALQFDDPESQLQFRAVMAGAAGQRSGMFHGHGGAPEHEKDRILRYFRQIDEGMRELLRENHAPLLLAGVDYYFPIYREANTYAHLLEEGVPGNPEAFRVEELHQRAWRVVEPYFQRRQERAAAAYQQHAGTFRATPEIQTVLRAAHEGRVESLFVPVGVQQWGAYDTDDGVLILRAEPEPGDEDLLDTAAAQTLLHGGDVFTLAPEQMPSGTLVAAVLRY